MRGVGLRSASHCEAFPLGPEALGWDAQTNSATPSARKARPLTHTARQLDLLLKAGLGVESDEVRQLSKIGTKPPNYNVFPFVVT